MRINRRQNKLIQFIKTNWISLLIVSIVGIILIPIVYRYLQDAKRKAEENKVDNATKLEVTKLENEVKVSNAQNQAGAPKVQQTKSQKVFNRYAMIKNNKKLQQHYMGIAQAIAIHLGQNAESTKYWFNLEFLGKRYDPDAWFENEAEVVRLLKKVPGSYPIIADLYHSVFTQSENLTKDLLRLLSKSELDQVRKHYKKIGNYSYF